MNPLIIFLSTTFFLTAWFQTNPGLEESKERGKLVYEDFCVTCHRSNGTGFGKNYPPLANSDFLLNKRKESIYAVKYGMQGEITVNGTVYNKKMEPLGLSDEEVADVMNYIYFSWGNSTTKMVTVEEVKSIKK